MTGCGSSGTHCTGVQMGTSGFNQKHPVSCCLCGNYAQLTSTPQSDLLTWLLGFKLLGAVQQKAFNICLGSHPSVLVSPDQLVARFWLFVSFSSIHSFTFSCFIFLFNFISKTLPSSGNSDTVLCLLRFVIKETKPLTQTFQWLSPTHDQPHGPGVTPKQGESMERLSRALSSLRRGYMGWYKGPQVGKGMDQDCFGGISIRKETDKDIKGGGGT